MDAVTATMGKRTRAQIVADLSPLTAAEHMECRLMRTALMQEILDGNSLAADEKTHRAVRLLLMSHEHVDDKLRHHTNAIQPRPGEPLPPDAPVGEPDPLDPRTAAVKALVDAGVELGAALAQVDAKGGT